MLTRHQLSEFFLSWLDFSRSIASVSRCLEGYLQGSVRHNRRGCQRRAAARRREIFLLFIDARKRSQRCNQEVLLRFRSILESDCGGLHFLSLGWNCNFRSGQGGPEINSSRQRKGRGSTQCSGIAIYK
jgi:hypothetical protein